MDALKYSIVVPVYNEEESITELVGRLRETMDRLDGPAEALLVDDGSKDSSYRLMLDAHETDPRFKVIQLSRNFGHQLAITAGMDNASGQAVVVMDADLQDPPHVILEMAAKWQEGYEVVYAVRQHRPGETKFKTATATTFYSLLRRTASRRWMSATSGWWTGRRSTPSSECGSTTGTFAGCSRGSASGRRQCPTTGSRGARAAVSIRYAR
jgi:dolichol-phosphate mannosyltransferase